MLIDLHAHTWPRSHDSVLDPNDLIIQAKKAGLDAICFTEHDTLWDEKAVKEIGERHNFLVLAGVEISTDDGHAYGALTLVSSESVHSFTAEDLAVVEMVPSGAAASVRV